MEREAVTTTERERPNGTAVYHRRTGVFLGIVAQRTISIPIKVGGVRQWADVSLDYLLSVSEQPNP
jgi:hypothetical protein